MFVSHTWQGDVDDMVAELEAEVNAVNARPDQEGASAVEDNVPASSAPEG